jgi:AcrR family transcriptional regulator
MPRTNTARDILEAARIRLLDDGYAALSTRKVAEQAGVPLSQIHYHHGSKDELILSLLRAENDRLLERQSAMFTTELPLSKQWDIAGSAAPDGLQIFPDPVAGTRVVAAAWTVPTSLGEAGDEVSSAVIWGVLDCTGAWAGTATYPEGMPCFPALGTMAASIDHPVRVGDRLVAMSWHIGTEGRRRQGTRSPRRDQGPRILNRSVRVWP